MFLPKKLLKGLYEKGYSYFGLEALSNCDYLPPEYCDTLLNERGYPLNYPTSGVYITEPQMSNLIRAAHNSGYTLFAYEKFGKDREESQAKYIAEILNQNPDAKVLILCGWYHLLEAENKGMKWMATYLKELTGIDPFTIYQDILIERWSSEESPFFGMMHFDKAKAFINEEGEFYNGKPDFGMFDALVYHPRTRFIYNRPDWLVNMEGNKIYPINDISINFPCLVKAFPKGESNESVPVDIIEKEYKMDPTALVLPPGEYRLEIINLKGEQEFRTIKVENEITNSKYMNQKSIIENYVQSYNNFDVDGMIKDLHNNVVFENISGGEVNLKLEGLEAFKKQAESAKGLFKERKQTIKSWDFQDDAITIKIDYYGILASDLPNGMKAGDELTTRGAIRF